VRLGGPVEASHLNSKERVSVARRGHTYPQVRVLARDLINATVGSLEPGASIEDGVARATRLDIAGFVLSPRSGQAVLRDDLRRAAALGLGDVPAARVARPVAVVDARVSEIAVRRELAGGAPFVVVRDGATLVGAVAPVGAFPGRPRGPSLAGRLATAVDREAYRLLRRAGLLAEDAGGRAFAVGGVVRDAVHGVETAVARDIDVVVEGDALGMARLLAAEMGGALVEHRRFLTASVRGRRGRRVDVASARAEHYDEPGALPRVRPAALDDDLRRRDFTVNAMGAELSSGALLLIDPLGGQTDLRERRLRVLHPLSFVEDPTRIFRGARYATRLGLTADAWTIDCRKLALDLAPYGALSGVRLVAELKHILSEPEPERALARLGADAAFGLLDRRIRYTALTAHRLSALGSTRTWAETHALSVTPVELLLLVLLGDQAPGIAADVLRRLAVSGEPGARLLRTLEQTAVTVARLRGATSRSAAAQILRRRPALELAWCWLIGDAALRRAVTRFVEHDAAVEPWLRGAEVVALGIARGAGVARVLDELRDGRLDGTLATRTAAMHHVRRRARFRPDRRARGPSEREEG
jgi:tRNA nucleotidyltransferase (CCA-adding enzyme)